MLPANQRLGLVDGARGQFDNGLVHQIKLLLYQCGAQVSGQAHAGECGLLQGRGKKAEAVAPRAFGHIQGLVGVFEQVFNFGGIGRVHADADAGRHKHLLGAQLKHTAQRPQHFLQNALQVAAAGQFGQDHRELVTAHAGHRVRCAHTGLNAPPSFYQQHVAAVMAQGVVDLFEVVQVDEQDGQLLLVTFAALDLLLQPVAHHPAVGQAGERVIEGLLANQCLGSLAIRNVGERANHAQRFTASVAADHHASAQHPLPAAILAQNAALALVHRRPTFKVVQPGLVELIQIIRMGAVVKFVGAAKQVATTITKHLQQPLGEKFGALLDVPVPYAVATALECQLPARLAFARGGLGQSQLGDVLQHRGAPERPALVPIGGAF